MVSVAVIIPCLNEEAAIGRVVTEFRAALPEAAIYVFDNASTDDTAGAASRAGADVRAEPRPGKGNVVTRAFADIEADIYVMADGDGTYDAASAGKMIELLRREALDMVVGSRIHSNAAAYRPGHVLGNRIFSAAFRRLFKVNYGDILSGYRVFSRRFVKSFPSRAGGFEIEIEMCAHAALLRLPVVEIATPYGERAAGGESKLNTWRDGAKILGRMFRFLRLHRPRFVYGSAGLGALVFAVLLFLPIFFEFLATGLVPRFPTLIVAVAIGLGGLAAFAIGAVLDAQAQHFAETKRLAYLRLDPPPRL